LGEKREKRQSWGVVLVDKQRRRNNSECSMLQRSMDLKKKNNLEPIKGNSFAILQYEELNHLTMDVNIKIGMNGEDSGRIIQNLIELEKGVFDKFVGENHEVLLPISSKLENTFASDTLKDGLEQSKC
jgi:hypothetical protein